MQSLCDIVFHPRSISVYLGIAGSSTLVDVPLNVFEEIERFALGNGWVRVEDGSRVPQYRSCSIDRVHTFPDLVIMWPESGYLFIPGEEYIVFEPSTITCRLRIQPLYDGDEHNSFINPLQFTGTNVRFEPGALEFCDPN